MNKQAEKKLTVVRLDTENSGGGYMVDNVMLSDGRVVTITDECAILWPSVEAMRECATSGGGWDGLVVYELDDEEIDNIGLLSPCSIMPSLLKDTTAEIKMTYVYRTIDFPGRCVEIYTVNGRVIAVTNDDIFIVNLTEKRSKQVEIETDEDNYEMCPVCQMTKPRTMPCPECAGNMGVDDEKKPVNFEEEVQSLTTDLLLAVTFNEIDTQVACANELANRGIDDKGDWIGYNEARRFWEDGIRPFRMKTVEDVEKFIKHMVNILGASFHPDTNFDDYAVADTERGEDTRTFSPGIAAEYNKQMVKAFRICNDRNIDIYEIALETHTKSNE